MIVMSSTFGGTSRASLFSHSHCVPNESPKLFEKGFFDLSQFCSYLSFLSRKELKLFLVNTNKAVETLTGGVQHAMEETGVGEASATRRLSIETSGSALLYPKGKAQGKITICRMLLPGKLVSRSTPDHNV